LAIADLLAERHNASSRAPSFLELLIARLEHVKVQMYCERGPHKRPHFHIEYKRQYRASYAIDTLEPIVGYMPKQYERPVIEWARSFQPQLAACWERLIRGNVPLSIELEPKRST
jgi:hypothetical protein